MAGEERPSLADYSASLFGEAGENAVFTEAVYSAYMNGLVAQVKGGLYADTVREMAKYREDYVKPDYLFLTDPSEATLTYKPLKSVLNKIYRKNVLNRKNWPPNQDASLITLNDFHQRLDDVFRTKFICRYLDGPQFVCMKLVEHFEKKGVECAYRDVTTELGYHAWHLYYKQPVDDFANLGPAEIFVELQFTTQLAEVISSLTHSHYEETRLGKRPEDGWRWDVTSAHFRPYYIAHGLHLLEGVILEYRDSVIRAESEGQDQDD